jgi:hypothetical protein
VFDLNQDPGTGNLNMRGYIASLVGPRRIVHGRRTVKRAQSGNPVPLLGAASGVEVQYFEVWLPQSSLAALPGGGAFLAFSSSESTGQDAFQILLSATQRFSGVLMPDDQIYVASVSDALGGALPQVSLVVSSVVF